MAGMNHITNEELLETIEREDRAFRDHWLFRELQCTPEDLFIAVKQYSDQMGIKIPSPTEAAGRAKYIPKNVSFNNRPGTHRFILRA